MGRSGGGGSSSGGHSSGGFGGGHSSGGFSGGGRSSGGSSYSSHDYGYSSGSRYRYNGYDPIYGYGYGHSSPIFISAKGILVTAVILILIFTVLVLCTDSSNSTVPKNTKQREALSGVVKKTDWYEDGIGWIDNKNTLISGLEDFYNATGIQPYVMLIPYSSNYWRNGEINATAADRYLESVYQRKFSDEGHFIFAYFQKQIDMKSEMEGEFRYLSGYSADTIMDNEALNIFWGYFEKNYYNTSLSLENMISKTFSETAKSIMSKPTNAWDVIKVIIIVVGVVAVVFLIYKVIKKKMQRDKEKEEYTKEILNTPLETFGEDTKDLEDKYK